METAYHAARMVAVQASLLSLLTEREGDEFQPVDGITVTLSKSEIGLSLDVIYTANGNPVAGEGM